MTDTIYIKRFNGVDRGNFLTYGTGLPRMIKIIKVIDEGGTLVIFYKKWDQI